MFGLMAMFLLVPLYFSHVFAPFGMIIGEGSSFERQKGYIFAVLLVMALFEIMISKMPMIITTVEKNWKIYLALLILPSIPWWLYTPDPELFFIGSIEKNHGYFWYTGMLLLVFLFQTLNLKERRNVLIASLLGASLVAFFAVIEWSIWGSPFFESLQRAAWWELRSVSTLGNPNYVAGYLLAQLALVGFIDSRAKYIITTILAFGILSTGSYIGIALMICFFGVILLRRFFSFQTTFFLFITVIGIGIFLASELLSSEKILSFESRYILMKELSSLFLASPLAFLIGFSPESILQYFDGPRSAIINQYFPSISAIDSSHNIFLDYTFQYGIISAWMVLIIGFKRFQKLPQEQQFAIVLVMLFLSFNVPVTVHIMMLILIFQKFQAES
jgi:hypothetical protein